MAFAFALWTVVLHCLCLAAGIRATLNLRLDQISRAAAPGAVHHSDFFRDHSPEILTLKCIAPLLVCCITSLLFSSSPHPIHLQAVFLPRATLPFSSRYLARRMVLGW